MNATVLATVPTPRGTYRIWKMDGGFHVTRDNLNVSFVLLQSYDNALSVMVNELQDHYGMKCDCEMVW
jgi:hypothetical protein